MFGRSKFYVNNTLCCLSPLPALETTHNGLFRAFQFNKIFKIQSKYLKANHMSWWARFQNEGQASAVLGMERKPNAPQWSGCHVAGICHLSSVLQKVVLISLHKKATARRRNSVRSSAIPISLQGRQMGSELQTQILLSNTYVHVLMSTEQAKMF